jgi:carbon monoxide dehydrogenase subunit G
VKIELTREVPAPIDDVWEFFLDTPRVVTCLPGASLTRVVDDTTFEGTMGMKVGPMSVSYQGTMRLLAMDPETHTVEMEGRGTDKRGTGTAQATIRATLTASSATSTSMKVDSDVRLTGRLASLGRGIQDVAGKIFEEFERRVTDELTGSGSQPPVPDMPDSVKPLASNEPPASTTSGTTSRNDIEVFSLLWSVLKDRLSMAVERFRQKQRSRSGGDG